MEASKIKREGARTKILLLLLEGIKDLWSKDKELHGISINLLLKEKPDLTKIGTFTAVIKTSDL